MDAGKRIDDLIKAKGWEDLTSEEKQFVTDELGSEEVFRAMKKIEGQLMFSNISPRPETLDALKNRLRHSKKDVRPGVLAFLFLKTPAYAMLLTALLAVCVGWFSGRSSSSNSVAVQTIYKFDTVRMKTPADTVFIKTVVYRDRKVLQNVVAVQPELPPSEEKGMPMGVSMKEKEELVNLLVSGSE